MNKATLLISTLVLAVSPFFTAVTYAESHDKNTESSEENAEMECVTQATLDEMSDEAKENSSAPLCDAEEAEGKAEESAEEAPVVEEEAVPITD